MSVACCIQEGAVNFCDDRCTVKGRVPMSQNTPSFVPCAAESMSVRLLGRSAVFVFVSPLLKNMSPLSRTHINRHYLPIIMAKLCWLHIEIYVKRNVNALITFLRVRHFPVYLKKRVTGSVTLTKSINRFVICHRVRIQFKVKYSKSTTNTEIS